MLSMSWNQAAIDLTKIRFEQLRSRVRRSVMQKTGNEAAKAMLDAVKTAEQSTSSHATGTLAKNFARKVKVYATNNTFFATAGARSRKITVTEYKDYRTGIMRRWNKGTPKKGPKIENPAKIIHLAGSQRRNVFVVKARAACRAKVVGVLRTVFAEEVMKR